ncbi:MAG: 2-oxoacid:acceptor oxidoreductase family protein [Deltaproteobacteria bacterium]|jgi:2-oxoglutarate ferredoxin oxidoreductase subunit gamma|nr:2-oxoacid:acceptor oxidoreductase family protein [Deltaproteobacteria bacterium]
MTDIICSGFGGQGVLTAGLILAKIAMDEGLEVTWVPSYGSEMRGGTANCNIKIDRQPIASPFVRNIDLLVAMNDPSVEKFEVMMKPGGILIVNTSLAASGRKYRSDIVRVGVPANALAEELENPRAVNIILLGAAMAKSALFEKEAVLQGLENYFSEKGKINPKNALALEKGWAAAA